MTDLDRYLDGFGARLREAKPPPRKRRGLALGGALGVATAVVVALLLLAPSGGGGARPGPVDAIAAARKALDPAGVILHMRVRTELPGNGIRTSFEETWSAQDPQRWRLKQWSLGDPGFGSKSEMAYGGGEQSSYERGRLTIRQGFQDDTPQTRLPTIFSQRGGDPDSDLRVLLTSGKLKDAGEQQSGGRTVRRLTKDDGLRSIVFDVDPVSFAPLGGTMTFRTPPRTRIPAMTLTFVVEAFERLPITPESEKLLVIRPAAGTNTTVYTAADMRRFEREYRAWRKKCRKAGKRRLVCPGSPPALGG
jgi:hypothetical protein